MFRCSRSNLETSFAADLQESQRLAPIRKQKVKHPVDLQCIELCSYMYESCMPSKKDHMAAFAYYASSSGDGQVNYRRLHDQQLSLRHFVLLPMQTSKWNTFKMFQMSTMRCFLHTIKIKAMQVCSSHFELAGWRSIDWQPSLRQESLGQPQSLSYFPGLLQCDSVIRSHEVLKDWHLIQCSQTVCACLCSKLHNPKIDTAVASAKVLRR